MNKADFISLIEQPDTLRENHIPALKNIAADFPYFQGAQLLLTKALYNEKHYEFEKQLKYASLMLPDRAVFFRYIHNLTESAIRQSAPVVIPEPVIVPEIISSPEVEPETEMVIEEIAAVIEPLAEPVIETIPEPEIVKIPETIINETEPVGIPEPEVLPVAEIHDTPGITEPVAPVEETIPEPVSRTISPNETHSFMEWLQLQTDQAVKPLVEMQETVIAAKEEIPAPQPEIQEETQNIREQIAEQVERSSNVTEFESILDKFIRENPKITRGKAEFYSPVNMAKQSVEQDEELVSETLANIYYKQGHYKKAIRAYEKLCLLYPHKLTYFADLIQKIKTENKD